MSPLPPAFHKAAAILVAAAALFAYSPPLALAALALLCWLARRSRRGGELWSCGTAAWAAAREVTAAGLTAGDGLVLGRDEAGRLMRVPQWGSHALVVSPTGGGKGVSCVVPTGMLHPGPVVFLDGKSAEVFKLLAAHRRAAFGREAVLIDPLRAAGASARRSGFNPIFRLRKDSPALVDDARALATAVVRRQENEHQPFFNDMAVLVLQAFIVFVVCDGDPALQNIPTALRLVKNPVTFEESISAMCASDALGGGLAELGGAVRHLQGKELASVVSTLCTHVAAFESEWARDSLSHTDFDPARLRGGEGIDVYLALPADKLESHGALMRLWVTSLLQYFVAHPGGETVLVVADEVGHLGHIHALETAVTLLRGFNVKLALFVQGLPQLAKIFPADKGQTALGNFDVVHLFNLNCAQTASWASERLGVSTIAVENWQSGGGTSRSTTFSVHPSESWSRSSNDGTQVNQTARPLLRPEEILLLRGRSITFVRGHPPVLGTPVRYFDDPLFAARPAAAAPGRRLVRRALLASLLFALLGLLGAACWRAASVAGKNATPRFGAPAAGSRWGVGK